jgi:hypothetical protein
LLPLGSQILPLGGADPAQCQPLVDEDEQPFDRAHHTPVVYDVASGLQRQAALGQAFEIHGPVEVLDLVPYGCLCSQLTLVVGEFSGEAVELGERVEDPHQFVRPCTEGE